MHGYGRMARSKHLSDQNKAKSKQVAEVQKLLDSADANDEKLGGYEAFMENNKVALAQDWHYKNNGVWLPANNDKIQNIVKDDKKMHKIGNDFIDHESNVKGGFNYIAQFSDLLSKDRYSKEGASKEAKENYESLLGSSGDIPWFGDNSRPWSEKGDVVAYGLANQVGGIGTGMKAFQLAKTLGTPIVKKVANHISRNSGKYTAGLLPASIGLYETPYNLMEQADKVKHGDKDGVTLDGLTGPLGEMYSAVPGMVKGALSETEHDDYDRFRAGEEKVRLEKEKAAKDKKMEDSKLREYIRGNKYDTALEGKLNQAIGE